MPDPISEPATAAVRTGSYVEWAPIFGGAVLAVAVSFVLLTFGSAVGLAAISPWSSSPLTTTVIWGGAFWLLLVQLWSFGLGGYIAGRMRHRWAGASELEVDFRDGAHGLLVWAAAVLLALVLAGGAALSVTRSAAEAGGAALTAATPATPVLDSLFRTTQSQPNAAPGQMADARAEAGRLLAGISSRNALAAADRTYLAQLVAARTGVSQQEAEMRVNAGLTQLTAAVDKARKTGVVVGFVTAASLLLGAAAAWWAAVVGGNHRDQGTIWEAFARKQKFSF